MDLKDKNAVIVGATGGIGRVLSLALALNGANVFLVGRQKEVLRALQNKIRVKGGVASVFCLDLSRQKDINRLYSKLSHRVKNINILIHAAGIGIYKPFTAVKITEWQKSLDVNTTLVFSVTQRLMPLLQKSSQAFVIALGSGMGKVGVAERSAYCASKFALRGLMLSLAKEYQKSNINFTLLTMGSILTAFGPLSLEEKLQKQKQGKNYLSPSRLAHIIITKIKNETLEPEVAIYPRNYLEESRRGKI